MPRRRRQETALDGTTAVRTPVEMFTERPETFTGQCRVEWLVFDELDPGDLMDSIRTMGILQPIAVRYIAGTEDQYEVVAGRRRATAARRLGLEYVPALFVPEETTPEQAAAMSLTENAIRRPNPLTDFQAIRTLMLGGANEQQISEQLHIPLNVLRSRMRLATLTPELMRRVEQGQISPTLAATIAPLGASRQRELLNLLEAREESALPGETVRLTAADVRQVREAVRRQASETLPASLFGTPTMESGPVDQPYQITDNDLSAEVSHSIGITGGPIRNVTASEVTRMEGEVIVFEGETWVLSSRVDVWLEEAQRQAREEGERRGREAAQTQTTEPVEVTITDLEGQGTWGAVVRLLEAAERSFPAGPNDDSDTFFAYMNAMLGIARRQSGSGQ